MAKACSSYRQHLHPVESENGELWELGENAVVLARPPLHATATPCLKETTTLVRFVCSAGECGQLLLVAEAAGFSEVSHNLSRSLVMAGSSLQQQLMQRLRPWLSEERERAVLQ
eukprot:g20651.t1